jgi:hypothetical protein
VARRGLFSRLAGIFKSRPEPADESRRTRSRTREPLNPFEQVWAEEKLSRPNRDYYAHRELFYSLPGVVQESPDEQLELWRTYLNTMTVKGGDRRHFENTFGVNLKRDFDWDEWRTAMGYRRRRVA